MTLKQARLLTMANMVLIMTMVVVFISMIVNFGLDSLGAGYLLL
ncbi:hypothetical protein Calni_0178 [Calditerrivibrio nitroreducens DSM 19672]|uniref:Uncharacterized protein n=1 Tax=Calditerrivibrio nitroreducens (strain DSM 19672 / NBRC 101217 / Yu37-1) TaxID=768670 RepID=E4TJ55_CALNY|nr:hypothetical protein Calni_0178 [Calditerrivibrio nitroreducens DSM 19672]